MKTKLINLIVLTSLFLFAASCKKGDDGVNGTPGKNGAANITSRTFTITNWFYSAPYHYANLNVPELTAENLNSVGALVYFSTRGNTEWIGVPYTQYGAAGSYYMGFVTSAGNVKITWIFNASPGAGDNPNIVYGTQVQYKVVIIPPAERLMKPKVDYTNYSAVKAAFNLAD